MPEAVGVIRHFSFVSGPLRPPRDGPLPYTPLQSSTQGPHANYKALVRSVSRKPAQRETEMISATAAKVQTSASTPWMSEAVIANERSLEAHEALVHEGDDTRYFYEVLEGMVSSYKIFADGRRQIISFAFPGDLIGFSHGDAYRYDCEAISPSRVRAIPKTSLLRSIRERPEIGEKLLALAALEVAYVEDHSINLGRKSAIERIASFLVTLAERAGCGDALCVTMQLPMSRLDMADFLGLTIETVSRSLTKLRARNIIELPHTSTLVVRNMNRLRDLAECDEEFC